MAKYKAYPEYKDSGVEWIGAVPNEWEVHSLKRALDGCVNGVWGDEPTGDNDLAVIRVADFDRNKLRVSLDKLTFRTIAQRDLSSRGLRQGDLLIEKSGGGEKTLVGCVVLFEHELEAVTSNFVARMRANQGFNSAFLNYCFSMLYAGRVNYQSIKQTTGIQNLDSDAYLEERFCFPNIKEQEKIAKFLDHETAKIDKLIKKQKQLIELLNEKRQAVISQAVTKGLNPSVPMKDSGVEWLGDVPEHWSVTRVGFLAEKIGSGSTPRGGAENYVDEGVLFLRSQNVYNDGLRILPSESVYIPTETHKTMMGTQVKGGDVLLNITGGSIGRSCLVPLSFQEANVNQHVCILRFSPESRLFLSYVFKSAVIQEQIQNCQTGGNREGLNFEQISKFSFCMPNEKELLSIVEHVDELTKKVDKSIQNSQKMIVLLYERRTSLISAAVTGKIDVRDIELI